MKLKKLAALLVAVALAFGATACASENVKTIATVNGEQIPSGVYLSLMIEAYNEAYSQVENPTKIFKGQVDGTPASAWIATRTEELFRNYLAVEQQFTEQGLTQDEEALNAVTQQAQYEWQMVGAVYEDNGVSYESYEKVVSNIYKQNALFTAQYGATGKTPVSDSELNTAFTTGYVRARYITGPLSESDGTELANEQVAQSNKLVLDQLEAVRAAATAEGGNFLDAILASEKEQAGEDGTVHAHDETSHTSYLNLENTSYTPEFVEQLKAMAPGEIKVLQTTTTAYLIEKMETAPTDMEQYRDTLLYSLKKDAFQELQDGWAQGVEIQYVQESLKLYKPEKLKFNVPA